MPRIGQLADAPQLTVHLLVQERLGLGFQDLDHPLVDALLIALAARGLPVGVDLPIDQRRAPVLGLEPLEGMIVAQEVAAGADLVQHVERLGVVIHRDAAQDALGAADDVVRRDQHVRAAAQALLDVADVVDHVAAAPAPRW